MEKKKAQKRDLNGKNTKYEHLVAHCMEEDVGLPEGYVIIHTKEWNNDEIVNLYKAGGWWRETYDPSGISELIRGSFDFVVVQELSSKRAVAMGRLISDGVSDGYIQDLVVFPEHRGKGIGAAMTRELVRTGLNRGLGWIGLIAQEGTSDFYLKLGFKRFKGEPMLFDME
ncbi:MAG: GNAT family N-acetyltransferase [Thermoplasmatota archaeon]